MNRVVAVAASLGLLATLSLQTQARAQSPSPAPIVFLNVAGPESAKLAEFYSKLFGWNRGPDGNWQVPVTGPLSGTVRAGDPARSGLMSQFADVATTLAAVAANGGTVDAPRFEVPGVAVLGSLKDPGRQPDGARRDERRQGEDSVSRKHSARGDDLAPSRVEESCTPLESQRVQQRVVVHDEPAEEDHAEPGDQRHGRDHLCAHRRGAVGRGRVRDAVRCRTRRTRAG